MSDGFIDDEPDVFVTVPTAGGGMRIVLEQGRPIVVVGANGAGKSALASHFQSRIGGRVNRIFAHRRLWLNSSAPEMTIAQKQSSVDAIASWDVQQDSRWRDNGDSTRVSVIIMELLDRENASAREVKKSARSGVTSFTDDQLDGPLEQLNSLLRDAGLRVQIGIDEASDFFCSNMAGAEYPIAEMSDGEKAALLLVGDVLTARVGSVHLIDEPERHLHRSISASLIWSLVQSRPDDYFVVFTHDLELAMFLSQAGETYVVTACTWSGKSPAEWTIEQVPTTSTLPEHLRVAVLGGRSRVLFHEGVSGGLDQQLYQILCPDWSALPVGGCPSVLRSVAGIRNAQGLHWLQARGVVDRDFRREDPPEGVLRLGVHEVENTFYMGLVVETMAIKQAEEFSREASQLSVEAYENMRTALKAEGVRKKIIDDSIHQSLRDDLALASLAVAENFDAEELVIPTSTDRAALETDYDALVTASGNVDGFLMRFPVRESPLRSRVARSMGYASHELYEQAVLQRARRDDFFRAALRDLLGLSDLG